MGACICKYKLNNKEYFVTDKFNNFIICMGDISLVKPEVPGVFPPSDSPPIVMPNTIETNKKILAYLTDNNNLTYMDVHNYTQLKMAELKNTINFETTINQLKTEKTCSNSCVNNIKYITNYDKTYYNLCEINLEKLYNKMLSIFVKEEDKIKFKEEYNKSITDLEKTHKLLLSFFNLIIMESAFMDTRSDIISMSNDDKNNKINMIKKIINDNVYNDVQACIIPYNVSNPVLLTNVNNNGLFNIIGNFVSFIALIVFFIIFLIYLLLYYFIGKTIGFIPFFIIVIVYIIITTFTNLIKK